MQWETKFDGNKWIRSPGVNIDWKYISESSILHVITIYWRCMLLHIFHGPLCICKYLQRYISIIRTVITFGKQSGGEREIRSNDQSKLQHYLEYSQFFFLKRRESDSSGIIKNWNKNFKTPKGFWGELSEYLTTP